MEVEPVFEPKIIHNKTDLLASAVHIDRYVMDAIDRLEEEFAEIHNLAMKTYHQLNKHKRALNESVLKGGEELSEGVTPCLKKITEYNELMEKKDNTPKARLQRLCDCCMRSHAFYQSIAVQNDDALISSLAEELSSDAAERIDVLKHALGHQCGCSGRDDLT